MTKELNPKALGISLGSISALCMLFMGILGNLGIYLGAADMMQKWHLLFSLTPIGIIGGIIEAAIIGFVFGWLIAWIYNKVL